MVALQKKLSTSVVDECDRRVILSDFTDQRSRDRKMGEPLNWTRRFFDGRFYRYRIFFVSLVSQNPLEQANRGDRMCFVSLFSVDDNSAVEVIQLVGAAPGMDENSTATSQCIPMIHL